jgi:hypothetical protein
VPNPDKNYLIIRGTSCQIVRKFRKPLSVIYHLRKRSHQEITIVFFSVSSVVFHVEGITQEQFENVSQQLAPRMAAGYDTALPWSTQTSSTSNYSMEIQF